jgi:hypothetical protein
MRQRPMRGGMRVVVASALALAVLLPAVLSAEERWFDDRDTHDRLAAGEIVVRVDGQGGVRGRIEAAVEIHATREVIWNVLRDCEHAPAFIPGLKSCRRMEAAPDGSWEIIEHDVKYSWLMPTIHSVFRADYSQGTAGQPWRIDFHRVGGDLREERGSWLLAAAPLPATTVVAYQVYVDPGFWVPQSVVHHSLRKNLPEALSALRDRAESLPH